MHVNTAVRRAAGGCRRAYFAVLAAGVSCLAVLAGGVIPAGLEDEAQAAGPLAYLIQYDAKKGETLSYEVLISETVYSGSKRTTNLYREEVQVEMAPAGDGRMRQTFTCSGTATLDGGEVRRLEPLKYYLTIERTGRILEAEGLRPWDGRQVETLWFAQAILADRPVAPGETWTVNDEVYSTSSGNLVAERRTYKFEGIERVGSQEAFRIKYEISRKGRANSRDYTYVGTGTFYLGSGKLVRLDSSEIVTYSGNGQDMKVITMIQVKLNS